MTPLAIYIHWPFCKSKCPYCDFNSHVRETVEQERWRAALLRELDYMHSHVPGRVVQSIFFGGGTPSLMPATTVAALIERVRELWPVADDIEITLEANPTSVEADTFPAFKAAGINRVSLGVQSLRDGELKFLGRGHSTKEAIHAIGLAKETFNRYSFDLIYARPNQTPADWEAELDEALALAGGHLSLYQLTIEENTAFHHAYAKGGFTLPDEHEAEALYRLTEAKLAGKGLVAYEVSNYALPGQESRHNMAYWLGTDYIGVGPGAHGRFHHSGGLGPSFSASGAHVQKTYAPLRFSKDEPIPSGLMKSGVRIATATIKSPERWLENVEKTGHAVEVWDEVPHEQELEERVMMGLRLQQGIGPELARQLNPRKVDFYAGQGLLEVDEKGLRATLKGRLVLNRLTAELL